MRGASAALASRPITPSGDPSSLPDSCRHFRYVLEHSSCG